MADQYPRELIDRMGMDDMSYLINFDYRDFLAAGRTREDVYQIANGYKTLNEVVGFDAPVNHLTDEQIQQILQRKPPGSLPLILAFAGLIALVVVCAAFALQPGVREIAIGAVILTLILIGLSRIDAARKNASGQ